MNISYDEIIEVKIIEVDHNQTDELNEFLRLKTGKIKDIQALPMAYGVCKFIIYYIGGVRYGDEKFK